MELLRRLQELQLRFGHRFSECRITQHLLQTNKTVENIGARRLHTVIEKIVEEISFNAPERSGDSVCPQKFCEVCSYNYVLRLK
jgi:ATP-dependent HslUV protease ATP-binding subunit HslU